MKRVCCTIIFCVCLLSVFLSGCGMGDNKNEVTVYGPGEAAERIRFYNGKICTMENGVELLDGELWVENGRVAYVGPEIEQGEHFDHEIDLEGNVLMPGFKNAHAHSPMTFMRSYADDLDLHEWLNTKIFPMEAQLTEEDVYDLYKLAVLEYVSSGITSSFDMYFMADSMAQAAVDSGYRAVFCGPINDFSESLEIMERQYIELNDYSELVRFKLGFHAEYTCSPELLVGVAALSEKYEAPVYFHNSETESEVLECVERYGMTPTAYLASMGVMDNGGAVFHAVHVTDEDMEILKEHGYAVVTNPSSNAKLASGIARVTDMQEVGIPVAIGTDGPSSNNALDMFKEMYLASVLQKVNEMDPTALEAKQALEMATVTGAGVMGLDDCDTLAVGKLADLIVIDLEQPNMQPVNNLVNNIVYAGGKQNIKLTMINGRILYENGEYYIGEDANAVYENAQRIIDGMDKA